MSHKVILADDLSENRELLRHVLENEIQDIEIYEADNGIEVLELLSKHNIDLILLDLIMPKLSGINVLQKIKSNPETDDIPIIVSSTISERISIRKTLEEGATDYFIKPYSKDELEVVLPLKIKNSLKLHEQQKIIKELNDQVETELRNANEFQNLMLPKSNEFKDLDLYIKYKPSIGIGGDFFDCTERGDELWFMIADVTGHGIVAAMISSMIKILFRSCVQYEMASPSQVLNKINKNVFDYIYEKDNISNIVFSAFVGKISEKTLFYSNAGQPYPVLYQDYRKEIVPLKGNGVNIGFFEESTYNEYQIKMNKDDMLLVYTDGLFSSGVNSDFADWPEVQYFCEDHIDLLKQDQNEFLNEILSHFAMKHRKNDSDYSDDIAIMLLKYK